MLVLKRPDVKKIAEHSCFIFSLVFNDFMIILKQKKWFVSCQWVFCFRFDKKIIIIIIIKLTHLVPIERHVFLVDILLFHFDSLDKIEQKVQDRLIRLVIDYIIQCTILHFDRQSMQYQIEMEFVCH